MSSKCVEFPTKNQLYEFFKEFGGTEESVRNDVQYLKEWIRKQPHLPNIEDDEWLTNFLFRCKNSLEKTKKRIDEYFITKATIPDIFQDRGECLDQMKEIIQQGCMVPSLKLTSEGCRLLFIRVFGDSEKITFNNKGILKLAQMLTELSLKKDPMRGWIIICDVQDLKMNSILQVLLYLKKGFTLGYKGVPVYVTKAYLINFFPALEPCFKAFTRFLKGKGKDKIVIWKDNPKNLISVLPEEELPTIYGGNAESLEEIRDIWYSELEAHRDWFISEERHVADLSKMPAHHLYKNTSTDFGVDGSFRKICLD